MCLLANGWKQGLSTPSKEKRFVSSTDRLERFWCPQSLLFCGYEGYNPPGVKRPERENSYSRRSRAAIMNVCALGVTYAFMA